MATTPKNLDQGRSPYKVAEKQLLPSSISDKNSAVFDKIFGRHVRIEPIEMLYGSRHDVAVTITLDCSLVGSALHGLVVHGKKGGVRDAEEETETIGVDVESHKLLEQSVECAHLRPV